ncbi:hypothetical protein FD977_06305 [Polynucleobacter sp. AP-Elch-400A-B2]|jgi:hypothetical protein|uniref:hypothetical protein n=1 Tax=Polynucleobacter sp. AP-Elch-400A-B2 TaxID=2576930 RepID=UPI001BFE2856|nr:hypothetical protein [Polynucleobacter sp. AP-Elch-400A-B2]QWE23889.1 hypothetical protein FD977_06305 [Polynucleobacter sp. AP-Elch-400A-B2]
MAFRISPKNEFHITERMTYRKDNKEMNCGFLWKSGSFVTEDPPNFLAEYDEHLGISVGSQDFTEVNLSSEGQHLIYFSETVPQDEQAALNAIFQQSKTTDDFDIGFQHKGWQLVDMDIVMWGELSITSKLDT